MSYEEYESENTYKTEAVNLNLILLPFKSVRNLKKRNLKAFYVTKRKYAVVISFKRILSEKYLQKLG